MAKKKQKQERNFSCKEGIGFFRESIDLALPNVPSRNIEHLTESLSERDMPQIIYPYFHALRADRVTRNKTFYPYATLKGESGAKTGIYSARYPYPIPYIKDHATNAGMFGGTVSEVYGRVLNAFMVDNALETSSAVGMVIGVPHPYAIENLLNGNWVTVSMGSSTEEAFCSLCGTNLVENPEDCDHWLNDEGYYTIIGAKGFKFAEISNVLVPSDVGAQKVEILSDPEDVRMYCGDINRESVYDISDPRRKNLLEAANDFQRPIVDAIWKSSEWLISEFKSARKQYFIQRDTAKVTQKETPMKRIHIKPSEVAERSDASFGIIYQDETTMKVIRRFPIFSEMSDGQVAFVKNSIESAKDITPEQREILLARLAEKKEDEPLRSVITKENYPQLLDILDEMTSTLDYIETEDDEEVPEDVETPAEEVTETPEASTEDTPDEAAEQVTTETSETETEDDEDAEKRDDEDVPETQEESILDKYRAILTETIIRQQVAVKDPLATSRSKENLQEFWAAKPVEFLEFYLEGLKPTFDTINVDVTEVETVDNPISQVVEQTTTETTETPIAAEYTPLVETNPEDVASLLETFGFAGFKRVATCQEETSDEISLL